MNPTTSLLVVLIVLYLCPYWFTTGILSPLSLLSGFLYNHGLLNIMILLSILGLCGGTEMFQRLNYGVVFKQTDKVIIGRDFWYHTFEIDLPERTSIPYLTTCTNGNTTCTLLSHLITQLNSIRSETAVRINATIQMIEELVPETHVHKSRSKRSLLPFIGTLSKGLFGTATMDDVNILANHINKINKITRGLSEALVQHENQLGSYMNAANKRMDNLMSGIKSNMFAIQYIQTKLHTDFHNLEYSFEYILDILIEQIHSATSLNHELDEFRLGIASLVDGDLSPLLIPQDVMYSVLNDVQAMLLTKFAGFHLSVTKTKDVYNSCKFLFARNGTKLYVTLKLPISNFAKPLTMYKVLSVPVPVNATSEHGTQILNLPNYFLVTSDNQYYTTLNNLDVSSCDGSNIKLCSENIALTPVTTQSCILALYANDKSLVKSLCSFRYVQSVIKPKIMELNPNSLLLYRIPLLSMQCLQEHKMVQGCDFCVFSLPCRCAVSTSEFYVAPRLTNCHVDKDNVSVVHPVNLALLQHFFDTDFVNKIFADTTFNAAVNVSIPDFKFYKHQMSDILIADEKAHFNLSTMAKVTKSGATLFQSLTEPLLDNQIQLNTNWANFDNILRLCTISTTVLLSVIMLWTVFKLRKVSAALLVLQNITHTKAMSTGVPSFVYKSKTANSELTSTGINIDLSWDHANFILLGVILLLMVVYLWKKCQNKTKSKICLEVTSGKHCVLIDIHSLPVCLSNYDINVPASISDLDIIYNCLTHMLTVSWPGFSIRNKLTDESIPISSEIPLSIPTAQKLKHILSKPFFVHIYSYQFGILTDIRCH